MSDQVANGIIAVALGIVVAVVLLVPTAAVQYRRDGALGPGDLIVLLGSAVYGLALWTYTLLPFPSGPSWHCQGAQLELLGSFRPIWEHGVAGPAELLHNAAFMQVALNVLLFVPLGFVVRLVAHRGVLVTTVLGFGLSLLIETTQRTGVWGLYHCAYRLFDVDDLISNTAGAFIGGVLAWILIHRRRRTDVVLPTRITLGRRWMGFVCDALVIVFVGSGGAVAWRGWNLYGRHLGYDAVDDHVTRTLQIGLPLLLEASCVLLAGRTIGEWVVATRAIAPDGARLVPLRRLVKLVLGVGAFVPLSVVDFRGSGLVLLALVLLTLLASLRSRGHRGLTHTAAGLELVVG